MFRESGVNPWGRLFLQGSTAGKRTRSAIPD